MKKQTYIENAAEDPTKRAEGTEAAAKFGYGTGNSTKCDGRCWNAEHPKCDCECGGTNHGCITRGEEPQEYEKKGQLVLFNPKKKEKK